MAGVHAAAEYQRTCAVDRVLQQIRTHTLKAELVAQGLPVIPNRSHIIPLFVGDAEKVKTASDLLLRKSHIYVQSINYPTVESGMERLRVTPTPGHTGDLQKELIRALEAVWIERELPRLSDLSEEMLFFNDGAPI